MTDRHEYNPPLLPPVAPQLREEKLWATLRALTDEVARVSAALRTEKRVARAKALAADRLDNAVREARRML